MLRLKSPNIAIAPTLTLLREPRGYYDSNRLNIMPDASPTSPFYRSLDRALTRRGIRFSALCPPDDHVARRVLHDYGAMFLGTENILPPPRCVFTSEEQVSEFQRAAGWTAARFGDAVVELQPAAMAALLSAREGAQREALDISPRDGAEAARRSYADSIRLWHSRFLPALVHWTKVGRLTQDDAERLRSLPVTEQVSEVLALEQDGIFFSKDLSKSVLYSIAAPGSSQHIAMLAFDVNEFLEPRVREILAHHGWFQTVLSDLPHFTYLGLAEHELPDLGLKAVEADGQKFWIPDVD